MQIIEIDISGMTCASCSGTIENLLKNTDGVQDASVNLMMERATIHVTDPTLTPERIIEEIEDIGFGAEIYAIKEDNGPQTMETVESTGTLFVRMLSNGIDALRAVEGVKSVNRTRDASILKVLYDPFEVGARQLLESLSEYDAIRVEPEESDSAVKSAQHSEKLRTNFYLALLPTSIVFAMSMVLPFLLPSFDHWLMDTTLFWGVSLQFLITFVLSLPVQYWLGWHFHKNAVQALKRRSANMDVLVSVSTNIAFVYGIFLVFTNAIGKPDPMAMMAAAHFLAMCPILMTVMLGGKYAESRARKKTLAALHVLSSARPATANLVIVDNISNPDDDPDASPNTRKRRATMDSRRSSERSDANYGGAPIKEIACDLVEVGDILRIFQGGLIPVDGEIIDDNEVGVDQSIVTGENAAVNKTRGDILLGGTVCVDGSCLMQVTVVGDGTAIGQIVSMVETTQATKAGAQRIADKVGRVFVPCVLVLSLAVFLIWAGLSLMGQVDATVGEPFTLQIMFALKFAMATMMIACPCAMGLATPTAVSVATGMAASRYGCLIKSAEAFETSSSLKCIVFDKTGTITNGVPNVVGCAIMNSVFDTAQLPAHPATVGPMPGGSLSRGTSPATSSAGSLQPLASPSGHASVPVTTKILESAHLQADSSDAESRFWWLAGSVEAASDHPLARSIVQHAQNVVQLTDADDFKATEGRGVAATVWGANKQSVEIFLGNRAHLESSNIEIEPLARGKLDEWALEHENTACTLIYVHTKTHFMGAIALRDSVQQGVKAVIQGLQDSGIHIVMCTGDNKRTAQAIANEVGIIDVVAEQLPSDKVTCVKQCQADFGTTCMVGDGINDAPALAQANLGVSIGAGVYLSADSSDVILVRSRLVDFHTFLSLSRTLRFEFIKKN